MRFLERTCLKHATAVFLSMSASAETSVIVLPRRSNMLITVPMSGTRSVVRRRATGRCAFEAQRPIKWQLE